MDISKLPRLSQTPATSSAQAEDPAEIPATPAPGKFCTSCGSALAPGVRFCANCGTGASSDAPAVLPYSTPTVPSVTGSLGMHAFVALIVALIFLFVGKPFGQYLWASMRHQPFPTGVTWTSGPKAGQEVAYFELLNHTALSDAGLFCFGVAMLVQALAMLLGTMWWRRRTAIVWLATILVGTAVLLNVGVILLLFSAGIQPLMSLLVVLLGGVDVYVNLQVIREMRIWQRPENASA